jgi:salicylate hydroxylase
MKEKIQQAKAADPDQSFESSLKARVNAFGGEDQLSWIYGNDIEDVWRRFLEVRRLTE